MSLSVQKLHQYVGHQSSIYTLAEAVDTLHFLSGGADKLIVKWNVEKPDAGEVIAQVSATIYAVCAVPSFHFIGVGTSSGNIHIIDTQQGNEIKNLHFHSAGIFDLKVSLKHHLLFSAGSDGLINVFSLPDFKHLRTFSISSAKLRHIDIDETSDELAIADGNGSFHILQLPDFIIKNIIPAHQLSCNMVLFHPNRKTFISAGRDAYIRIWDRLTNFQLLKEIPAHNFAIYDIKYLDGLNLFASASRDKTLKIWTENFDFLKRISLESDKGHINSVNKLYWNTRGQVLFSAGDDKQIMAWKILS